MTTRRMMQGLTGAALLVLSAAAGAQDAPVTIPDLGNFSLPAGQPSPTSRPVGPTEASPAPTPTPAPSATPTRSPVARPTPRPAASPTPQPTPTARTRRTEQPTVATTPAPVATPTPSAIPSDAPAPAILPSPVPTVTAEALPPAAEPARPFWLFPTLLVGLILAATALFLRRRRKGETVQEPEAVVPIAPPVVPVARAVPEAPSDPMAPPVVPAPRFLEPPPAPSAQIEIDAPTVSRAGVNLVTATADLTVTVRNPSDVAATGIALDVRLLSAQPGQDAVIDTLFSGPVDRPATPRFDLAPGETKRVRVMATMPRDAITVLTASERPMFVPVVAIRAVHVGGQTRSVHAIGIERAGQAKLGPFWLDVPSRMYDTIGVRPHSAQ